MARRCVSGCFIVKHILKPVNTEKKDMKKHREKKTGRLSRSYLFHVSMGVTWNAYQKSCANDSLIMAKGHVTAGLSFCQDVWQILWCF